jgi:hypothetical protein
MSPLMQELLEHKRQRRRELAALPFPEKVKIVEQMRETTARIRASTLQVHKAAKAHPPHEAGPSHKHRG